MHARDLRTATRYAFTAALVSGVSVFLNKYAIAGTNDPVLFTALKNDIVALFLAGIRTRTASLPRSHERSERGFASLTSSTVRSPLRSSSPASP